MKHILLARGPIVIICLILISLSAFWFLQDDQFRSHKLDFIFDGHRVAGQLVLPHNSAHDSVNCLVFVHGDGAMSADGWGYYDPYFLQFAQQGWCSFSWDKPGVEASAGNWLDMDMNERAELVVAALDALRNNPIVKVDRVGLIGFSQAGWVLPKV